MSDLLKTPIDEIINNRAKLMGLATNLFNRTSPQVIRAFGQFGRNPDLAKVIEAKRNGIFDYGVCIQDTPTGVRWPTDTAQILSLIEKAETGVLSVDDLIPVFQGNREVAEELFPKVYLKAGAAPKAKKPKIEPKVEVAPEPEPPPEVENVVQFKAPIAPSVEETPVAENLKETPTDSLELRIARQEELIQQSFRTLNEDLNYASSVITHTWDQTHQALVTLAENQRILNENLRIIATCFGDLQLANIQPLVFAQAAAPAVNARQPAEPPAELPPAPAEIHLPQYAHIPAARAAEPVEDEVDVDEALLARLDLAGLRELGVRLGIKNADQLTYTKVLKKKIRAAVGLPAVTD